MSGMGVEYGRDGNGIMDPGTDETAAAGGDLHILIDAAEGKKTGEQKPARRNGDDMAKLVGLLADAFGLAKMIQAGGGVRSGQAEVINRLESERQMLESRMKEYREVIDRQEQQIAELTGRLRELEARLQEQEG
jgi:hypothetical protein